MKFDRNTVIGFALIAAIVIVFSILNRPSKAQLEAEQRVNDSLARVEKLSVAKADSLKKHPATAVLKAAKDSTHADTSHHQPNASAVSGSSAFTTEKGITESPVMLENELMKITLSTAGGKISSVQLKKFKTWDGKSLVLFNPENTRFDLSFLANNQLFSSNDFIFTPSGKGAIVSGKDSAVLTFRAYADSAKKQYVEEQYTIHGNSYMLGYNIRLVGLESLVLAKNNPSINLIWHTGLNNVEKTLSNERNNSSVYYKYTGEDADHILEGKKNGEEKFATPVEWVSFKQHFFNSTLILNTPVKGSVYDSTLETNDQVVKVMHAELSLPYEQKPENLYAMRFYFGPNDYPALKKYGIGLQDVIPLGYGIFHFVAAPISRYFIIPLFQLLSGFNMNYGIIILIMTLLIKLILTPFTLRTYRSQVKMRVLKPELDELRAKYKDDQTKFGQEQMKLFQRAGVNPLGGCLPLLFQIPILASMYTFFPNSIEMRQQSFLWAKDLTAYDSIVNFGFSIPFLGDHLSLFTILMTVTSLYMSYYNSQMSSMTGQMKWMQYLMPIVLLGIFNNLPAALTYYYFLFNLLTLIQQWAILKFWIDEKAIHAQIQENKKKPVKKNSWTARLEAAAKQRQQMNQRKK